MIQRRTLKSAISFEGLGLHSGIPVRVTVEPGDQGIRFRHGASIVEAIPENVTDTTRCTKLGEISTIEHLMSALGGLEITDAEIEVTAPELPAMGGGAQEYVLEIQRAGVVDTGQSEMPELFTRIFFHVDDLKIAISKGAGHWSYLYSTGMRWPGEMHFDSENVVASYTTEISPARTFALSEEVPHILAVGLAKGLDDKSALILGLDGYENASLFPDEPARHKLLDLIGDLYLAGVPISHLNVSAERSGHQTNVAAAAQLRKAVFGN